MELSKSSHNTFRSAGDDATGLSWGCDVLSPETHAALQDEWISLGDTASENTIFQSASFASSSLPMLGRMDARAVTIRQNGLLTGIVILRRDTGYGKLPVPFWRSALHHEQFLGTPMVRAGYEAAFAAGLCGWLDQAQRDCFFVILSKISADGAIAKAITQHCSADKRAFLMSNAYERAAIVPRGSTNTRAEEGLTSSRRRSIRKSMTGLAKEGEVSIQTLTKTDQLEDWTSQFLAMENTGWKRESGSSILSCEHETALYRAMIASAFHAGNLHFSRLCLDGAPIAYTLDIAAPPTGYCLKSAIDQRYRKFSPGVLMEYETLKHYFGHESLTLVDSCSAQDNELLNELWPDRRAIADLAIARKGPLYSAIFQSICAIKTRLGKGLKAKHDPT